VDSRLAAAGQSGAGLLIDVRREGIAGGARRASAGAGFDMVLVGPGKREVVAEALAAVAPGGTLLLFTMAPPSEEWVVGLHDLYFREVSVVPSYSCGPGDTREALRLIADRRVSVADLVTQRFGIGAAVEAFSRAREPEGSMKVVFAFPE
jgi:L-iditol 2-dehydrogenase